MNDRFTLKTRGDLVIGHVFGDGLIHPCAATRNALQNTGCGAAARCLAVPGASVNIMYFLFCTAATTPQALADVSSGGVTLATIQTADASYNYCRVPVIHVSTAGTEGLGDNIVTFHGVTAGSASGVGAAFETGSKLYAAALACSTSQSAEDDIIFSVANIMDGDDLSPVIKVANAQLGIRWQVSVLL